MTETLGLAAPQANRSDFDNHAPVYLQIALILREKLGVSWKPGDRLPSESDIAQDFGVNRNTIRRAIGLLVDDGLLERRRGINLRVTKLPVAGQPKLEAEPTQLFRMRPGTEFKVLAFEKQVLGTEAAHLLEVPAGTEGYRIDRLLLKDSDVLAYLTVFVPVDIGRKLLRVSLRKMTIASIVHSKLGIHVRRVRQSIEAALADAGVASALGTSPGAATLKCRYVISEEAERPVVAAVYYYRGDRFKMTLEINTPDSDAGDGGKRLEGWPLSLTSTSVEAAKSAMAGVGKSAARTRTGSKSTRGRTRG